MSTPAATIRFAVANIGDLGASPAEWGALAANVALNGFAYTQGALAPRVLTDVLDIPLSTARAVFAAGIDVSVVIPKEFTEHCARNVLLHVGEPESDTFVYELAAALKQMDGPPRIAAQAAADARTIIAAYMGRYSAAGIEGVTDKVLSVCAYNDVLANIAAAHAHIVGGALAYTVLAALRLPTASFADVLRDHADVDVSAFLELPADVTGTTLHREPSPFARTNAIGWHVRPSIEFRFLDRRAIEAHTFALAPPNVARAWKAGRCSAMFLPAVDDNGMVVVAWHAKLAGGFPADDFSMLASALIEAATNEARHAFAIPGEKEVQCVLLADSNLPTINLATTATQCMQRKDLHMFNDAAPSMWKLTCYGASRNRFGHQFSKQNKPRNKAGMCMVSTVAPTTCNDVFGHLSPPSTPSFDADAPFQFDHLPVDAAFPVTRVTTAWQCSVQAAIYFCTAVVFVALNLRAMVADM